MPAGIWTQGLLIAREAFLTKKKEVQQNKKKHVPAGIWTQVFCMLVRYSYQLSHCDAGIGVEDMWHIYPMLNCIH